jgi:hypothetical protein
MSKPGPRGPQPPPDGPATPQGPVTAPTTTGTESTGTHYESPPSGATAGVFAVPAVSQAADDMGWVPSAVLDVKAQLEEQLSQATSATAMAQDAGAFTGIANVQGVAIGVSGGDTTAAAVPGSPCLVVYVAEPAPDEQVHDIAAQAAGVSSQALTADVPIKVVRVGIVEAHPHRFRLRPAPAGVSVGHVRITAGTIGCFVTGRSAPRSNRMLMLSNNHVLANVNSAATGDVIIRPGPVDGGSSPSDEVAILDRFVPIDFSGQNFVDCATAWCWPDRVQSEFVFLSGGTPQFFQMSPQPVIATINMAVTKSGRTTQVTTGTITGIAATVNVNYNGRIANFRDQIAITGNSGPFSLGGDSGSLIMTNDSLHQPVGLLFAGGATTTFANRIDRVLDALDIQFSP